MVLLLSLFSCFVVALFLTGRVRQYAITYQILDSPNERSSHSVPTPRGGGVAIATSVTLGMIGLWCGGYVASGTTIALLGAGGLVALTGFWDDHQPLSARWRLLAHLCAAVWALFWMGDTPSLALPIGEVRLGWLGVVLFALYLVWLLNLYNFMDGIDGIASVEAIFVGVSGAVLSGVGSGVGGGSAIYGEGILLPVIVSAAALGFLWWNFPPAKIFMGDAGSGFLGITLGALSLLAAHDRPELLWSWLILLAVFIGDATLTLLRRFYRRLRVYEAHRSHAYQYASRRLGTHRPVTLTVCAINLFWLFPIAWLVASRYLEGVVGLLLAYSPVLMLAYRLKAGAAELQEI